MSPVCHFELVIVARELQSRRQILVPQWPIPMQVIDVVPPLLQIDLDGLRFVLRLANKPRISPTAANVGEAADMTEYFSELLWLLPSNGESTDAARRDSADRSLRRVAGNIQSFQRDRQEIVDQKVRIPITHRVVLERPIAAIFCSGCRFDDIARIHKHRDRHWHLLLMNQVVKHDRYAKPALGIRVSATIHEHHQRRREGCRVAVRS